VNNEASQEEREVLQRLLEEDEDLGTQYEILSQYWKNEKANIQTVGKKESDDDSLRRILFLANTADNSIEEYIEPVVPKRNNFAKVIKWGFIATSAAACLAFLIVKNQFVFHKDRVAKTANQLQVITTPEGTRTRTILPDGSVVWLNSGSTISFNNQFQGAARDVKLEGEGYFDVAKSSSKPFIVHVANIDIHVLGTAFNVRSYPRDSATETTLVSGLVQITSNKDHNADKAKFIIHPNEKISILKNTADLIVADPAIKQKVSIRNIDTSIKLQDRTELAWIYNRLVFHGETFAALAERMERWYNIKIVFEDEKVAQLSFNGSFENENVAEAFKALTSAIPFNYKIEDQEVYVSSTN